MCHTGVEFSDSTVAIFTPDAGRGQESLLVGLLLVAVKAERLLVSILAVIMDPDIPPIFHCFPTFIG